MRKNLEDRFTMFLATRTSLDNHGAVWAALVPFSNAVTAFRAKIVSIEDEVAIQEMDLLGYAKDKALKKETMAEKALSVARQTFAFAEDTGDVVLREKMSHSRSTLMSPRDAVVAQKCQGIHTEATAVLAGLAPYGILAADLTELQTLIDDYEAVISAPRTAITVRKGSTEQIETLIQEGTLILTNRLDKMMDEFKLTSPGFYQEYFDARIVVNTGAKKEVPVPTPPGP